MKKIKLISVLAACSLAVSLAACGAPASSGGTDAPGSESQPGGDGLAQQTEFWFGRVSAVAGNELTLELAAEPEAPADESQPPVDEDGGIAAMPMQPATPAEEGTVGAEERQEIELSGETKDFTIPGGLSVKDASGAEKQLSDIKKGSLLSIATSPDGQVIEVTLHG